MDDKRLYAKDLARVEQIKPYRGTKGFDGRDPNHALVWFKGSNCGHVYLVEDMGRLVGACREAGIVVWDGSMARKMSDGIARRRG